MLIHHLIWIQAGSGGYGDLRIRKKQTNISVDAIRTSCVMGSVPGSG